MVQFFDTIFKQFLSERVPKKILEIGALYGNHSLRLANWCKHNNASLTIVDPTPWSGLIPQKIKDGWPGFLYKRDRPNQQSVIYAAGIEEIANNSTLLEVCNFFKEPSLIFLNNFSHIEFDTIFLDGDHNYYTIFHELNLINQKTIVDCEIFIHDVHNPSCAYVDYYYDWKTIPNNYYKGTKQGIIPAISDFLTSNLNCTYDFISKEDNGLAVIGIKKHE